MRDMPTQCITQTVMSQYLHSTSVPTLCAIAREEITWTDFYTLPLRSWCCTVSSPFAHHKIRGTRKASFGFNTCDDWTCQGCQTPIVNKVSAGL
eukprot:5143047-Amphidinium_carterae.1